jgi:hypothetical protein
MSGPTPSGGVRRRGSAFTGCGSRDVRAAFVEAERRLGTEWRLKGRGRCRRVTLGPSYARAILPVSRSRGLVSTRTTWGSVGMYPLPIVEEAARILGVTPWVLVGKEY